MNEIVLDTETTGLSVENGHRIIEIGCRKNNFKGPFYKMKITLVLKTLF